jgi:hypothetical protein
MVLIDTLFDDTLPPYLIHNKCQFEKCRWYLRLHWPRTWTLGKNYEIRFSL